MTAPKLLLIELNEFSPLLLEEACRRMDLPHLVALLNMPHSSTTSEDEVEHQGLDPWVQWVGVHTGHPTRDHGVKRLGVTVSQTFAPIWERLGRRGLKWGVWGAMNAPRTAAPGCQFFMPDPWSFDEKAFPPKLNDLLALPRYAATNYLEIDKRAALAAALRVVRYFVAPSQWGIALRSVRPLVEAWARAGANVHTFSTLFDYIGVLCFTKARQETKPDFSLIFLNHIAHLQHQFWRADGQLDPNMELGLRLSDKMLGLIFASRSEGEGLLIANGMRQKNVAAQGFHIYRQIQPQRTIAALGISGGRVEQCMTNDGHIIFGTRDEATAAAALLRECQLSDGASVFDVEDEGGVRIFYQLAFDHQVAPDALITNRNGAIAFTALFDLICERTGAHEQRGDVYHQGVAVPAQLFNHELFDAVMEHFGIGTNRAQHGLAA